MCGALDVQALLKLSHQESASREEGAGADMVLTHDRSDELRKSLRAAAEGGTYEYVGIDSNILIRLSANR